MATYEGVDGSACAYSVSSDNTAVTVTTVTINEVYSLRIAKNRGEGCLIIQTQPSLDDMDCILENVNDTFC